MKFRVLWFLFVLGMAACAHERAIERPPAPPAAEPVTAPTAPAPAPVTTPPDWSTLNLPATAPTDEYAAETTGETFAEAETAPPVPERPSPPPLGAESLAALPDAALPARGASLKLAQEGRLAWLNRDAVVARQRLQSALQLWGGNPYAKYYLGILELEDGHYAQAESFAREATRKLRDNPFYAARAYLLLALTLERSGDLKGAFAARARADELDPRVELK